MDENKCRYSKYERTIVYRDNNNKVKSCLTDLSSIGLNDVETQLHKKTDILDDFWELFSIKNSVVHTVFSVTFGMLLGIFIVLHF
ncbi:Hypothetical protein SRAE_2000319500 [Strongyloides ratti]|uniref:Uncharacterized protein n=1 Tax=Strongyloides ratti TaxID=34506 RepID=A0A090MZ94_STRRB|nr:Hypothetical protein SRAE_2000319500 [Strongyloides ratti]CEF68539.1 Hypothetical protein SRAE_2000319500 [Strongyloides ratti]